MANKINNTKLLFAKGGELLTNLFKRKLGKTAETQQSDRKKQLKEIIFNKNRK